jgi:selenide, water dikinase
MAEPRLTSFSHGAGCGCKLGPADLLSVLGTLSLPDVPHDVLVAADTADDAAVYLLPSGEALVATLDFFTPIVDDPYDWGRIAAVNALSDVYAMGARPFLGLNIVGWPVDDLPLAMLGQVLQGGIDVAAKAGVAVLGGHSITDPEPKYGMVVLGLVRPDRIVRNSTARAGDALFLTKPIGLGIVSTAIKRGEVPEDLVAKAVDVMTTTNQAAAEAMLAGGVDAATDVTGFGLLGHLHEMLQASGLAATIDGGAIPLIDERVMGLARSGAVPGGTRRNRSFVQPHVDAGLLDEVEQLVLADAQTSGGLLVASPHPDAVLEEMRERGVAAVRIGTVEPGESGRIRVEGRLPDA